MLRVHRGFALSKQLSWRLYWIPTVATSFALLLFALQGRGMPLFLKNPFAIYATSTLSDSGPCNQLS